MQHHAHCFECRSGHLVPANMRCVQLIMYTNQGAYLLLLCQSFSLLIYTGQPIATALHAVCLNSWPAAFLASLDLNSASDSQTASSLRTLLQRFCNTLSPTCMAMHYMPNSYAKHPVFTLMLRALIQTIYRALLSTVPGSGIGHRIHTIKKKVTVCSCHLLNPI